MWFPDSFFEPLPEGLLDAFEGGGADNWSESIGLEEGDAFEQQKRQWANKLRAFYDQKNHPSHHEDLPTSLNDVIARLQAPRPGNQKPLVAQAEKYLMAAGR